MKNGGFEELAINQTIDISGGAIIIESNELYSVLIEEKKYYSFIENIRCLNHDMIIEWSLRNKYIQ